MADSVAGDDTEAARAAALAHELEAEATVAQVNTEVEVEVAKVAPVAAEAGEQPSEGAPLEAQPTGGGEEQATSSKAGGAHCMLVQPPHPRTHTSCKLCWPWT